MYRHNPQTKQLRELLDEGAIGELRLVRTAFSYSLYDEDEHPPAHRPRGRRADGRRLLLRQRLAALGGEPETVYGQAWFGPSGTDWVVRRDAPLPRRRARALRLRHRAADARRARGDRQRGLALPRRPVALQRAGDRAAPRRRASSGSRSSARTRTGSSSRTSSDAIRGEAELLLGRDGRGRPGAHARGAASLGDDRRAGRRSRGRGPRPRSPRARAARRPPRQPTDADGADPRVAVERGDSAEEEREERIEARTLRGVVAHLLRELRCRASVTARRGVRLPLRIEPCVGRRSVHRRGGDELTVIVGDEDGDRPGRLGDDVIDHGLRLRELHALILTDS